MIKFHVVLPITRSDLYRVSRVFLIGTIKFMTTI